MNRAQQAVCEFQVEHRMLLPPELAALDFVAEVGELAKEVLLATNYGTVEHSATPNIEAELGDACYALISLANSLGLDMGTALYRRLAVYRQRFGARRSCP